MSEPVGVRPSWLTALFGSDVWTVFDAEGKSHPIHWVRGRELGTIEQERGSSELMWRRVVYQSQPKPHEVIKDSGVGVLMACVYFPSAAFFVGFWGVVAGVALGFLLVMSHRSQHRRRMRPKADGLSAVLIDAGRCPVCRELAIPLDERKSETRCESCGCT